MPYSLQEKRLRRIEANRRYREKHKEKLAERNKKYNENNKEKKREYNKKNKEARAEYYKTENGKRVYTISNWKKSGLIVEDYNIIYDRWLNSEKCEMCLCEYKMTKGGYLNKCLEHSHITGKFRSICCWSCNAKMRYIDENHEI